MGGSNTVRVRRTDSSAQPISGAEVTVTSFMPAVPSMNVAGCLFSISDYDSYDSFLVRREIFRLERLNSIDLVRDKEGPFLGAGREAIVFWNATEEFGIILVVQGASNLKSERIGHRADDADNR